MNRFENKSKMNVIKNGYQQKPNLLDDQFENQRDDFEGRQVLGENNQMMNMNQGAQLQNNSFPYSKQRMWAQGSKMRNQEINQRQDQEYKVQSLDIKEFIQILHSLSDRVSDVKKEIQDVKSD